MPRAVTNRASSSSAANSTCNASRCSQTPRMIDRYWVFCSGQWSQRLPHTCHRQSSGASLIQPRLGRKGLEVARSRASRNEVAFDEALAILEHFRLPCRHHRGAPIRAVYMAKNPVSGKLPRVSGHVNCGHSTMDAAGPRSVVYRTGGKRKSPLALRPLGFPSSSRSGLIWSVRSCLTGTDVDHAYSHSSNAPHLDASLRRKRSPKLARPTIQPMASAVGKRRP